MIEFQTGNILEADAEALVNTVNTVGVMGKGIAYQFKKAWPAMEKEYASACKRGEVQVGQMYVWEAGGIMNPRFIINFPTKKHWRNPSQLSYIQLGLKDLVRVIRKLGIRSVAVPPLGCGNGGLDWNLVKPEIEKAFQEIPEVRVLLYEPAKVPVMYESINNTKKPPLTVVSANIFRIIYNYYILEYFNPLMIEVQKLLYFYEQAGQPLDLRFEKNKYGPYSNRVYHLLSRFDGHYIKGLGSGETSPFLEIELLNGIVNDVEEYLSVNPEKETVSTERADQVLHLIEGFENPYGMELLASVHWIVKQEKADSEEKVIEGIRQWTPRKAKIFSSEHIQIALERLKKEGWI